MTSRQLTLCLAALLVAALACTAPGAETPAVSTPTAQPQVIVVTATPPAATSGPVAQPTVPTAPPTAIPPSFSPTITFAETADIAAGTRSFHGGVTRIYALWQYFNMSEALLVRRDWYRDGELWITKSERWSVAKYGRDGTMKDVSIYDLQDGLPSGHYELQLYINDVPQFGSADDPALRSFDIEKPGDGGN